MADFSYAKAPGVRSRQVEGAAALMVFTEGEERAYHLNLACWYLFELSDGNPGERIAVAYADTVAGNVPREQALDYARTCLAELVKRGILLACPMCD
ncbi:MAG: hypothetical protein M3443_03735 [Actinomycetota bacterium]|nr:hypothetical protein [Actinomycetota bacterium]